MPEIERDTLKIAFLDKVSKNLIEDQNRVKEFGLVNFKGKEGKNPDADGDNKLYKNADAEED